jgi:hypothetical protein
VTSRENASDAGFAWQQLYDAIAGLASDPAPLRDRLREIGRRHLAKIEERGVPPAIATGLAEFRASMERMGDALAPTEDLDFEARAIAERVLHMYDRLAATMRDLSSAYGSSGETAYDQSWELFHRSMDSLVADDGPLIKRLVWGYREGLLLIHEREIPPDIADELARLEKSLEPALIWFDVAEQKGRVEEFQLLSTARMCEMIRTIVAMYARVGKYQDIDSVDDDLVAP